MTVDVRLVTCAVLPAEDHDTPLLEDAFRANGLRVDVADWRDPKVDWAAARLTLVRSPWDYADVVDEFCAWTRAVERVSRLWNPADLIAWNVHKSYLLDLETRGVPVVPTVLLLWGSAASIDGICDARGWNEVVIKPAVGVGAIGSGCFAVGAPGAQGHLDELLARGDVLVQPFVATVETAGEVSVVLVDGVVTHAVRKLPRAGDYRVQEEWGGTTEAVALTDGLVELAQRIGAVLPAAALYSRVDVLQPGAGWQVVEVEVTEPSLWLDLAPAGTIDRFVGAVVARLG